MSFSRERWPLLHIIARYFGRRRWRTGLDARDGFIYYHYAGIRQFSSAHIACRRRLDLFR